jgi:hypothetical protein
MARIKVVLGERSRAKGHIMAEARAKVAAEYAASREAAAAPPVDIAPPVGMPKPAAAAAAAPA